MSTKEPHGSFSVDELPPIAWEISTQVEPGQTSYVEAGPLQDGSGRVAMRHSEMSPDQVIVYTRAEWDAFVGGVKDGEFDFGG